MKFLEMVEALQEEEKNLNKIILVKCGVFFVAIGKDAILLHEILGLNVTCIKPSICKVGIPISNCIKYTDKLEKVGYGYILYDYNSKNKKIEAKYEYDGVADYCYRTLYKGMDVFIYGDLSAYAVKVRFIRTL